jgi:hypothetical protein
MLRKVLYPFVVAAVAVGFTLGPAETADAQGIHFRSRGVHIDVGNPHGHYGHRSYGHYPSYPRGGWAAQYHSGFYGRGHYDYHPTEVIRHGHHYHVVPGHYDYHRGGHGHGYGPW